MNVKSLSEDDNYGEEENISENEEEEGHLVSSIIFFIIIFWGVGGWGVGGVWLNEQSRICHVALKNFNYLSSYVVFSYPHTSNILS